MRKLVMIIGMCCLILTVKAQDIVSDFMKNYEDTDVFTQVSINSKMFQLIADMAYEDTESIIQNLTGMKILTTDQEAERYFKDAKRLIEKRFPQYEVLMNVKEQQEQVWMYIRENKGTIVELVILVGNDGDFVLMNFTGKIDLKKIAQLTKSVKMDGIEYLDKVKDVSKKKTNQPKP